MRRDRAVNTRKGARALLLAAALLTLLGACTGGFLYNRLDFIIPFYVGQRVTLDDPQEEQLRAAVRNLTSWHRTSQLSRYSAFLRELARESGQPTTREQIESVSRTLETFYFDAVREALPDGYRWLRSLSREQLDELLASYDEEDAEDRGKYCEEPREKQLDRRAKNMKKSVRKWSGSLDPAQTAIVDRTARTMNLTGCQWLDNRQRWRAELKAALFDNPDPVQTEQRVRMLLLEPQTIWTEDYRRSFEQNKAMLVDMIAELDGTWSEKQRKHIVQRLNGIAEDLEALET